MDGEHAHALAHTEWSLFNIIIRAVINREAFSRNLLTSMFLFTLISPALLLSPVPFPLPPTPEPASSLVAASTLSSSSSLATTTILSLSALDGMKGATPVLPEEELTTSYNRGNSYLMQGQFEDALASFNRALELSPNNADILLSRGIVYEKLFQWQSAIDDYQLANSMLKKRPFAKDDATAFSNLANAETGLLKWEEALRDYTYASKLDPKFVAPQLGRSLVLYELGRPQESIAYFKQLASKYPYFADGQAALAVMLWGEGENKDVMDMWETAIEQDSRYRDVEWVRNIRRWPPSLVGTLEKFMNSDIYRASIDS